jgi:hypothetical protein
LMCFSIRGKWDRIIFGRWGFGFCGYHFVARLDGFCSRNSDLLSLFCESFMGLE